MLDKIKNNAYILKAKKVQKNICDKYNKARDFFSEAYNKHIIYMYIVTALLVTLVVEMMARASFFKAIYYLVASPYIFICNAVIIMMTLSITLLMKRRFFGMTLISIIWIAFGITNSILLSNRVTPLTATDLRLIDSALGVLNKYFSIWQVLLVLFSITIAIALLVFMFIKAPHVKHKINRVRNVFTIVLIWIIGFGTLRLGVASELIPKQFGNLRNCYEDYGFVYCFSNSIFNTGVEKPSDYSDSTIKKIVQTEDESKKVKKKPNIIFLQLESFFDLNNMKNIELSANPVPNFEKLMKNYASGYLSVPIVGAGTVNTEFEVMTGMNLDDFGPGEYPFKTILKNNTCESICFNLKKYDYSCHALHNNTAMFYGRNQVFSNLGYDTFTSIENMNIEEFTPMGWAKDYVLTENIINTLKSTKNQDYIYAISVQGHGSYPSDGDYEYPIKITGFEDDNLTNQYQYYAWQTNEMDNFIGELIKALEDYGEDTILVMYGDHLPSLGITAEDLKNESVYQTQYVIWSNYDFGYENEDIEAYQLQSKILEKLNMTAGEINNYTQKNKNSEDYLEGLHNLEYDQLYGDKLATNGENPYVATELKFGLNEVKVNSIAPINDETGTVYIYGNYFTGYSKVYINDEKQETTYVDPNTLMIVYPNLKEGDNISVYQQNSDEQILTQTEPYIYTKDDIQPAKNNKKKSKSKSEKKQK